ncbi:MAG: hypothetical protein IKR57_00730 [Bacilli bacterium]|nr:hypothetical protein [Bacilli bacterium]
MAKRKKRKTEGKKGFPYTSELIALLLMLLSVVGLGSFGVVGELIKKFAIFMFGSWYVIFLGLNLLLGIVMLAVRSKINYLTGRLIGVYTVVIVILALSHVKYISDFNIKPAEILKVTISNIDNAFTTAKTTSTYALSNTGGGMVGAVLSYILVSLFDIEGSFIVIAILAFFGFVMIFDLTLSDIGKAIIAPFKKIFSSDDEEDEKVKDKKSKRIDDDDDEDDDEIKDDKSIDKRVVITSVEDITSHRNDEIKEDKKIELPVEDNVEYVKPGIELLDINTSKGKGSSTEVINSNTRTLERVFRDFGMTARVVEVHVGPAITQYEMNLERGTKVNKVLSISREIALALAAKEIRIEAPIPGKNTIGVEVPNQNILPVSMREIMESKEVTGKPDSKLLAPLGRDIMGRVKIVEINKTPHMLVAGATGSGKSVCINNIILSILMRTTPEEVKMVLVDPKKVEFNVYDGIPHLITPVVTDPKKASAALQRIVGIMDERYETFKNTNTKNITTYNEYVEKNQKKDPTLHKMPFILVIIDELADLMLVAAKEVEESIMRITQLARAAGIHLIVATQRPSTDVITGVVKANIPTRISFAVSSSIDSRTILDMTGAEKLLGKGDMLYKPMDDNAPTRIQGSFVSDAEIARVVDFIKNNCHGPRYSDDFTNLNSSSSSSSSGGGSSGGDNKEKDVMYNEILDYAIRTGQISASLIQRKFSLGYNRAARIMDTFEEEGIVGPAKGSKPRDVLVKYEDNNTEE